MQSSGEMRREKANSRPGLPGVREDDDRGKLIVKNVSPKSAQFDSSPSQLVFIIFTRHW